MRGKKSIFAKTLGILLVLIALVMQTVSVYAEDEKCTLNIEYAPDGNKVNDVEFTIYKVGEFDINTKFSWYGDFTQFDGVIDLNSLEDEGWRDLGTTLKGYVDDKSIGSTASTKTVSGKATFNELDKGLYLVVGKKHNIGDKNYYIQPSMVYLPQLADDGTDNYECTIIPKYDCTDLEKVKIVKIWVGAQPEENASITVNLLRDGQLYEAVVLSDLNNWQHEITGLEKGHEWSVAEQMAIDSDWTVTVEQNMHIFEVRNRKTPETPDETPTPPVVPPTNPPRPTIPFTGLVWWPVPVLMGSGFMLIVLGLFLKRKEDEVQE